MACEQRMLNGGTAVDSVGLVHTRYTLSPDVCWVGAHKIHTLSRRVLGLVVQSSIQWRVIIIIIILTINRASHSDASHASIYVVIFDLSLSVVG